MIKKIAVYILCIYFLVGNVILPLGDYSLMRDLPAMYQSYEKIVSPDENGILDFIGDYLLGGKDILGHNKGDAPQNPGSTTQFQHTAGVCSAIIIPAQLNSIIVNEYRVIYQDIYVLKTIEEFHKKILRPPLA
jgi:hypothetical protein